MFASSRGETPFASFYFMTTKNPIYLLFLLVSLLIAACNSAPKVSQSTTNNTRAFRIDTALTVAVMPTIDCLPIFLAADKHWFAQKGLAVKLNCFNAQMDCDTAVTGGSSTVFVSDLVRCERLKKRGFPIVYITTTPAYWQLYTNKHARIKEAGQLGDKMIAMTRYSITDYLATEVEKRAKAKNPIYRIQINDVILRLHMLLNNEMDAMFLPEPQATVARTAKNTMLFDSRDLPMTPGVFAYRVAKTEKKEQQRRLAMFRAVYNMACDSINKYGVAHYASIIETNCKVSRAVVKALPSITFHRITPPLTVDIDKARKF